MLFIMSLVLKVLKSRKIPLILIQHSKNYSSSIYCRKNVGLIKQFLSKSIYVTGYYVFAGCCFSKQDDKETLLSEDETSNALVNPDEPEIYCNIFGTSNDFERINQNVNNNQTQSATTYINDSLSSTVLRSQPEITKVDDKPINFEQTEKMKHKKIHTEKEPNCSYQIEPKCKRKKTEYDSSVSVEDHCPETVPAKCVTKKSKAIEKEKEKPIKQKPNYFVAVQISNDKILQSLKTIQNHILQKEERLAKSMTNLKTLHITLLVMYIADLETHGRAMKALRNVHGEINGDMSQNPLKIEFQGLGHFRNRVLYAKVQNDEAHQRLISLAESVRKHFAAESLLTTDAVDKFTPHMTVAKIDYKAKGKGKTVKKIDPVLYEEWTNEYFGSHTVESIQLCCMTTPKNEAGYYSNEELFFTGFSPKERLNTLKKSLAIEEQKKDVKQMINALMKDSLK